MLPSALRDATRQAATLTDVSHRPWPLPRDPWLQGQTWVNLVFLHWPVDADVVRPLVPRALDLDVRDGSAWLGVTPFVLRSLRVRGLPPAPPFSTFPELNVRTYVTVGDKPGIYFFSLDAASRFAVAASRRLYRLPYYRAGASADTTAGRLEFTSERRDRREGPASFRGSFRAAGEPSTAEPGSLLEFLTERYCLYTLDDDGRPLRGEIHHPAWRIRSAVAEIALNTMARPPLSLPGEPLHVHFSDRQDVVVWKLEPAG